MPSPSSNAKAVERIEALAPFAAQLITCPATLPAPPDEEWTIRGSLDRACGDASPSPSRSAKPQGKLQGSEMKSTDLPIEGPAATNKRFCVIWEGDIKVLRSFDSLDEAIAFIQTLRLDRRHYVRDGQTWKIVWPQGFKPLVRERRRATAT